jgi:ribonuclease P protein component
VRVSGRHIQVFLLLADSAGGQRLGISVPRRVGTAVARNRVRRRLREIFRRTRSHFGHSGVRLVINVKPAAANASFQELLEDYRSAVTRALTRRLAT